MPLINQLGSDSNNICFVPAISLATVFGGSNLGPRGYPELAVVEPVPSYANRQAINDNYRWQVESYVQSVKAYSENASNDIKRIQESRLEAIDNANRVVEAYQQAAEEY